MDGTRDGAGSHHKGDSMVRIIGETALVTDAGSAIGRGITRALLAAGSRVLLADRDESRLAQAVRDLGCGGAVAVLGEAPRRFGPISLRFDLAAAWPVGDESQPFRLCRWRQEARGARVLTVRPLSALAVKALLVPGSLSSRVARTSGLGSPDDIGRQIVASVPGLHYLIATRSEWSASTRPASVLIPA